MKMQCLVRCLIVLAVVILPMTAMAGEIARVQVGGSQVDWEPVAAYESLVLTVARPDGSTVRQEVAAGGDVVFELAAGDPDGVYTWELRAAPRLSAEVRRELQKARRTGDATVQGRLRREGKLPADLVQSGSFTVLRGGIVPPDREERPAAAQAKDLGTFAEADQVIPDDLIVQGSGCFGFDCVNNESFGFDTIRLKENNLRIKFEDTSVGTFPSNDWQLTANDSASGGSNKFSIEDITGAKVPFTITAGASTNSIFVDSTGRVGFRTSTPVLDLHVTTSNTPAMRLEQNNSGGFTAQTWDIAGNEANFFVRDVTGGSRLPFRIRPGAPTSSIDISSDGDVGIGDASPDAKLDVETGEVRFPGGTASTNALNTHFNFVDDGINYLRGTTVAADDGGFFAIGCRAPSFDLEIGNGTAANCGTGTFSRINAGSTTFTASSSRTIKENLVPVSLKGILEKISAIDVYKYDFISGPKDRLGLMAEDFHQVFQRGSDKLIDGQEVEMALWLAVKELTARNEELLKRLTALEARLAANQGSTQEKTAP